MPGIKNRALMFQKTDLVGLEKHATNVNACVLGHAADPLQTLLVLAHNGHAP